jgi:hypothetical protein
MYGRQERLYKVLVWRTKGKRSLGRPRRRRGVNIKMDHQEMVWGGMDWIDLAQSRDRWPALVNAVMDFRVLQNAGNFLTGRKLVGFVGRTLLHRISYIIYFIYI